MPHRFETSEPSHDTARVAAQILDGLSQCKSIDDIAADIVSLLGDMTDPRAGARSRHLNR